METNDEMINININRTRLNNFHEKDLKVKEIENKILNKQITTKEKIDKIIKNMDSKLKQSKKKVKNINTLSNKKPPAYRHNDSYKKDFTYLKDMYH